MSFIKDQIEGKMKELEDKIVEELPKKLEDPAIKKKVVDKLNAAVNIPILNESVEEKIFGAIYDVVVKVIVKALSK
tara:strand:+ start:11947 stop:12174 length:228 start_codon:yes stop_codon:yes gene_type:complete